MIDVGRDGVVHVGYRQRNEHPGTPTARSALGLSPNIDTYYQESRDDGKTWSAPLRVNRERTDVGYAAFSRGGAFLGDYNQVAAASNGTTYVVHNEALPAHTGEKCNCTFRRGNGHQHQYTYVGVVGRSRQVLRSARAGGASDDRGSGSAGATSGARLPQTGLSLALPITGLALLAIAATMRRKATAD